MAQYRQGSHHLSLNTRVTLVTGPRVSYSLQSIAVTPILPLLPGFGLEYFIQPETKVHEDFKITEKAPTSAFSWLKALVSAFT